MRVLLLLFFALPIFAGCEDPAKRIIAVTAQSGDVEVIPAPAPGKAHEVCAFLFNGTAGGSLAITSGKGVNCATETQIVLAVGHNASGATWNVLDGTLRIAPDHAVCIRFGAVTNASGTIFFTTPN